MLERDSRVYFQDILDAIARIEKYTKDFDVHDFTEDAKTIDAVVRNLEIIGEAASRVPRIAMHRYDDIPWEKMISMRNKVIHEYAGVDVSIIWQTIKHDLPALKKKMVQVLREERKP